MKKLVILLMILLIFICMNFDIHPKSDNNKENNSIVYNNITYILDNKSQKIEIQINVSNFDSLEIITSVLNNTSINLLSKIKSIHVVSYSEFMLESEKHALGKITPSVDINGKLLHVNIYLVDFTEYNDSCVFEETLHHEIGHLEYYYLYNNYLTNFDKQEEYAEEYKKTHHNRQCDHIGSNFEKLQNKPPVILFV